MFVTKVVPEAGSAPFPEVKVTSFVSPDSLTARTFVITSTTGSRLVVIVKTFCSSFVGGDTQPVRSTQPAIHPSPIATTAAATPTSAPSRGAQQPLLASMTTLYSQLFTVRPRRPFLLSYPCAKL